MASFVDGDRHRVEHHRASMPCLGRFHHVGGKVVSPSSRRSKCVGLTIELFRYRADEAQVNAIVAKVAGDFPHGTCRA